MTLDPANSRETGGGGALVAYAEVTSDVVVTSTNEAAQDTVVSLGAVTYTAERHRLEFSVSSWTPSGNPAALLSLWDDTTMLYRIFQVNAAGVNQLGAITCVIFVTPTAASHTYIVKGFRSGGTSFTLEADPSPWGAGKFQPIQLAASLAA